jgi:hypothetical protein
MTPMRAALFLLLVAAGPLYGQPGATLQGRVFDASGAVVARATVSVRDNSTGFEQSIPTDSEGRYQLTALPSATYTITASAAGFRSDIIDGLSFEVGRTLLRDFHLTLGDRSETVIVIVDRPLVDRATSVVGHVVTANTVQEIPLNGRYFADLGLLVPGSVAPSQTGFSTTPFRARGALAINTGGNREEAVGFLVNGVTSNNLAFGSLGFQPPIASVQEFKVDNSAFSPEYGHVSGAIVNIVTRSGTDEVRGEAFEFFRNDALDARNFFEFSAPEPHPFNRHQFGGAAGGPVVRGRSFFFVTYEGLTQRQGLDMNSLVLSDEQRSATNHPVIQELISFIPRANIVDAAGNARFVGSAFAVAETDRLTGDLRQNIGKNDRVHLFYGRQWNRSMEPGSSGTTIPGFGIGSRTTYSLLTINHTHLFGPSLLHEARFGRSALAGLIRPARALNPALLGIGNGVNRPIGLPQMAVAGDLNFGGPAGFPAGRDDALYIFTDAFTLTSGRHSVRFGAEYRQFLNANFAEGTGAFNFPTIASFLDGTANAFSITLGERRNHIDQRAIGFFVRDGIRIGPRLTVELGLRYSCHLTPTEKENQFVVFDSSTSSLLQVGVDLDDIYRRNDLNFEPRVGFAWDWSRNGRRVLRAAYAVAVDQPGTTTVSGTAANPPFAIPLAASGSIPVALARATAQPANLAPSTVDPGFTNASLRSWNVNVQQQLATDVAVMAGYFGSSGRHLRISRNLNQPVNGVRPFVALSASSPIVPGTPLGNITQVESSGFSSYHALWVSATKRLARGLQFDASYTWSKSLDTNSLNSSGFAVQDSYDIPNQYGPSDFDARHRFVLSATYQLPFNGHVLTRDWQVAGVIQSQSGNPINIVTSNSTLNGTPNTVRPDVAGPVRLVGSVDEWFDTSAFVAVNRFGNLGRNALVGPAFHNTDVSIIRHVSLRGRVRLQFRVDVFDVFNHPNFGPPGNLVGSPAFGRITRTRLPTGEAGSSRQMQLAVRFSF